MWDQAQHLCHYCYANTKNATALENWKRHSQCPHAETITARRQCGGRPSRRTALGRRGKSGGIGTSSLLAVFDCGFARQGVGGVEGVTPPPSFQT